MIVKRFEVEHDKDGSFVIVDKEHERWNMPRLVVSLHFGSKLRASDVCSMLNNEWMIFLKNPS